MTDTDTGKATGTDSIGDELSALDMELLQPDFPFSVIPLPTIIAGFTIGVLLLLIWAIALAGFGYLGAIMDGQISLIDLIIDQRDRLTIMILIAYVMTVNERGRSEFIKDYLIVRPVLKSTIEQRISILTSLIRNRKRNRLIWALIACVAVSPIMYSIFADVNVSTYESALVSLAAYGLVAIVGAAAYDLFDGHRRIILLMDHGVHIDLLDMRPMQALARSGVRSAAATAIGCALAIPLLTQQEAVITSGSFILFMLVQALLMMMLPARKVHLAIVAEKTSALEKINAQVHEAWQQTLDPQRESAQQARAQLAGLMALRDVIEKVREWPFGAPTLLRMVGLGALPVLSWIAAALMEQLVERSF